MFQLIEAHSETLVASILPTHVPNYDWLVENIGRAGDSAYQSKYRAFWAMNAARLSPAYCAEYFRRLAAAGRRQPALASLATDLFNVPTQSKGRQSLQFSFVTKLVHMHDHHSPIYDSQIAAFYFFRQPDRGLDLAQRVERLVNFHAFLSREYARILANGLLRKSMAAFRARFKPVHFTDEKVIDSLIWATVSRLRDGGLRDGSVIYR
ncbi:MAG: hypothetical protein HYR72_06470 [Deltaproteobacteria bacterium]|nr:hypothetical protein [Deltaproteobacteria bacterium]MBI3387090.1 hypothetical protein [Deltaproteobacteria bacterium]